MGTRGLTVVIKDGTHRIAQYGQWDHYPAGQGVTALNFLRSGELESLEANLDRIEWLTNERYDSATHHITGGRGYITVDESAEIDKIFPFLSRNHGAGVLSLIAEDEGSGVIYLRDEIDFVRDSLFNEGTYVIDLDSRVFEVYVGFQESPHNDGRFASQQDERGYYPVRLVKSYSLDNLPTTEEFLEDFSEEEA